MTRRTHSAVNNVHYQYSSVFDSRLDFCLHENSAASAQMMVLLFKCNRKVIERIFKKEKILIFQYSLSILVY